MVASMVQLPPTVRVRGRQRLPTGWQAQWARIERGYRRLPGLGGPDRTSTVTSDDLRDDVVHFFMDCYHLKDWLKNDPAVTLSQDVERYVEQSAPLCVVADVANGQKHLKLKTTKTGDLSTSLGDVTLEGDAEGITVAFEVVSQGQVIDMVTLSSDAMHAWTAFLLAEGLLTRKSP